jgi:hypothetical protein
LDSRVGIINRELSSVDRHYRAGNALDEVASAERICNNVRT